MDEFDEKKRILLQPLYFEAGAALHDCQGFEYGIALLLFYFGRWGTNGIDPSKISLILDNKDKKTAGQLISLLKQRLEVSNGIEAALDKALSARNLLIHRVFIDNVERIPDAQTRAVLVKEIRALRRTVRQADAMLRPFIMGLGEVLDGVDAKVFEAEVRRLFS